MSCCRTRFHTGICAFALGAAATAVAAEAARPATIYSLQATTDVDLVMPVVPPVTKVLYRNAADTWEPVAADVADGVLRLHIEVAKIRDGRTLLVLNVPADVDLDDVTPPAVVRCTLDGKDVGTETTLDLGGLETAPRAVSLRVRDERNALVADSLEVSLNGRRLAGDAAGVSLKLLDPKQAQIDLDLARMGALAPRNALSVRLDDCAVDEAALVWSLSFRCAPVEALPDGGFLSVDSVTAASGWEKWQVVCDGQTMAAGSGTTAGRTWLSEENGKPHWISLRFAAPRAVNGVALWWAFYECYRTSSAYEVQTWDGATWVTQLSVKEQKEGQCSRHAFPAAVTTTAVRVWQPPNSGHAGRAAFMWLSEFEVF